MVQVFKPKVCEKCGLAKRVGAAVRQLGIHPNGIDRWNKDQRNLVGQLVVEATRSLRRRTAT